MDLTLLLTIIGAFIAIGLAVNAFFLRAILSDLTDLKVKFATILEKVLNKEKDITKINEKLEVFERRISDLERGV